jgi:hypothetical protein
VGGARVGLAVLWAAPALVLPFLWAAPALVLPFLWAALHGRRVGWGLRKGKLAWAGVSERASSTRTDGLPGRLDMLAFREHRADRHPDRYLTVHEGVSEVDLPAVVD